MNIHKFSLLLLFVVGSTLPFTPSPQTHAQTANIVLQNQGKQSKKLLSRISRTSGKIIVAASFAALCVAYENAKNKKNTSPNTEHSNVFNEQLYDDWFEVMKTTGKGFKSLLAESVEYAELGIDCLLIKHTTEHFDGTYTMTPRFDTVGVPSVLVERLKNRLTLEKTTRVEAQKRALEQEKKIALLKAEQEKAQKEKEKAAKENPTGTIDAAIPNI